MLMQCLVDRCFVQVPAQCSVVTTKTYWLKVAPPSTCSLMLPSTTSEPETTTTSTATTVATSSTVVSTMPSTSASAATTLESTYTSVGETSDSVATTTSSANETFAEPMPDTIVAPVVEMSESDNGNSPFASIVNGDLVVFDQSVPLPIAIGIGAAVLICCVCCVVCCVCLVRGKKTMDEQGIVFERRTPVASTRVLMTTLVTSFRDGGSLPQLSESDDKIYQPLPAERSTAQGYNLDRMLLEEQRVRDTDVGFATAEFDRIESPSPAASPRGIKLVEVRDDQEEEEQQDRTYGAIVSFFFVYYDLIFKTRKKKKKKKNSRHLQFRNLLLQICYVRHLIHMDRL